MAIRPCRPDINYFAGTAGRVVRASASHGYTMMYMCMGSNPGPGKKFVKNDFTNQVKFELSTLRHYLSLSLSLSLSLYIYIYGGVPIYIYMYIKRITMCHSGSMATPALGTQGCALTHCLDCIVKSPECSNCEQ